MDRQALLTTIPHRKCGGGFQTVTEPCFLAPPLGELSCDSMTERGYRIFAKQIFDIYGFSIKIQNPLPKGEARTFFRQTQKPTAFAVGFQSYFLTLSTLAKYSFVSFATVPDRANRAIKLGIAIRPLKVSATSQTTSKDVMAPMTTTGMKIT